MIMLYPNIKKVSKEVEKVFEQEVLVYSCVARGWYLIEKMLTDTVVEELILVVLVSKDYEFCDLFHQPTINWLRLVEILQQ